MTSEQQRILTIGKWEERQMNQEHYIFRWKDSGICVEPSRRRTADECWAYALEWLRPAFEPRAVGRALVRKNGEVIKEEE